MTPLKSLSCVKGVLGGEVEADTQLMTAGGKILDVRHGGKGQLHARFQYLRVRDSDLRSSVDLGLNGKVFVNVQFGGQSESRGSTAGVGSVQRRFQFVAVLLVQRSGDLASVVDASVEGKITGAVARGEVALGQLAATHVKRHLVTSQDTLVSEDGGSVDDGGLGQVGVEANVDVG